MVKNKPTHKSMKIWISKCNSLHGLQSIRSKINKRIKIITIKKEKNPFLHIPIEQKREVIKDLLI